jgi:hypothetical protein
MVKDTFECPNLKTKDVDGVTDEATRSTEVNPAKNVRVKVASPKPS